MSTRKDRSDNQSHHEQMLLPRSYISLLSTIRNAKDEQQQDSLSYFSFQPKLHDCFNKGRSMHFPVFEKVHIEDLLLFIERSGPLCGDDGFPVCVCVCVYIYIYIYIYIYVCVCVCVCVCVVLSHICPTPKCVECIVK